MRPRIYNSNTFGFSSDDVEPRVLEVILRLNSCGFKAYIVGGGVRDLLLGKTPKDYDLVTDARPNQIKKIFRNARVIGRRFKLVHIYFSRLEYLELATFRQAQTDSPSNDQGIEDQNEFGTEETDAFRRDLTINGLYYDPESDEIIDYVGGVEDLQAGIIRIIGDPPKRIAEDPVRMLRVLRHAGKASFNIDSPTLTALQENADLIKNSAPVRIYEELRKDFSSGMAFSILRQLYNYGLLKYVAPELAKAAFLSKEYTGSFRPIMLRTDELAWQDTSAVTATSVQAVIVLAYRYAKKNSFIKSFAKATRAEMKPLIERCFSGLALPKKEVLRLAELLDCLRQLAGPTLKNRQLKTIKSSTMLEELRLLLSFLNHDSQTKPLIDLLN